MMNRISILLGMALTVSAQSWVARYNGAANGEDQARAITIDGGGNIYVTGYSWGGASDNDWATVKYTPGGESVWVVRYDGPDHGSDQAQAIAAGSSLIVVTGGRSNADFTTDIFTVAYNSAGVAQWSATYDGPARGNDMGLAVALDSAGNVYVAGYSSDTLTGWDMTIIKYSATGAERWVRRYVTVDEDYAVAVIADANGYVYVTGSSGSPYTLSWDYVTIKYDTAGNEQWVARYNGPGDGADEAKGLAVDVLGNVYVTGVSEGAGTASDFRTIKYSPDGETLRVWTYDGAGSGPDGANAIALLPDNSVVVTGYSFDPASDLDCMTIRYDAFGNQQWAVRFDGSAHGYDEARAILADNAGNVYVVGTVSGSATRADYLVVKYDVSGNEIWAYSYDGPANRQDEACAAVLDLTDGLCVTGASDGQGTGLDYATVRYPRTGIQEATTRFRCPEPALSVSPNPVRTTGDIEYELPVAGQVRLELCDVTGRCCWVVEQGKKPSGRHRFTWVRGNQVLPDGIYLLRLTLDGLLTAQSLHKLILLH